MTQGIPTCPELSCHLHTFVGVEHLLQALMFINGKSAFLTDDARLGQRTCQIPEAWGSQRTPQFRLHPHPQFFKHFSGEILVDPKHRRRFRARYRRVFKTARNVWRMSIHWLSLCFSAAWPVTHQEAFPDLCKWEVRAAKPPSVFLFLHYPHVRSRFMVGTGRIWRHWNTAGVCILSMPKCCSLAHVSLQDDFRAT